ncbi:cuticle protein 1-like, partial [Hetaerina americana]|uniref:cuticle protein 1-like n=1 Tax=Hetaerina americana TaxID=62018 RepID=UPI003A7F3B1C
MVSRMIVLALFVAVAAAAPQAAQYPAGVDPHTCPNYPNCDNVALAAHAAGQHYAAAPQPHYAPAPAAQHYAPAPAAPQYAPGHQAAAAPATLPAGVDARACPNYPYCGPTPAHVPAAPAHHGGYAAPAPAHHGGYAA